MTTKIIQLVAAVTALCTACFAAPNVPLFENEVLDLAVTEIYNRSDILTQNDYSKLPDVKNGTRVRLHGNCIKQTYGTLCNIKLPVIGDGFKVETFIKAPFDGYRDSFVIVVKEYGRVVSTVKVFEEKLNMNKSSGGHLRHRFSLVDAVYKLNPELGAKLTSFLPRMKIEFDVRASFFQVGDKAVPFSFDWLIENQLMFGSSEEAAGFGPVSRYDIGNDVIIVRRYEEQSIARPPRFDTLKLLSTWTIGPVFYGLKSYAYAVHGTKMFVKQIFGYATPELAGSIFNANA